MHQLGSYDAKRKFQRQDGSQGFAFAAFTVVLEEYQGQPRISLLDNRTGERFPCFFREPRGQGATPPAAPVYTPPPPQYPPANPAPPAAPPQGNWNQNQGTSVPAVQGAPQPDDDVPF